jgi:hypothetical protein
MALTNFQLYINFVKETPDVIYEYVLNNGMLETQRWAFRNNGMFGCGYYRLTKNGRRHPQSQFKIIKQVHNELLSNKCSILEK